MINLEELSHIKFLKADLARLDKALGKIILHHGQCLSAAKICMEENLRNYKPLSPLESVHKSATGLYRLGLISKKRMEEFDRICNKKSK